MNSLSFQAQATYDGQSRHAYNTAYNSAYNGSGTVDYYLPTLRVTTGGDSPDPHPAATCDTIVLDGTNTFAESFDTLTTTGDGRVPSCWSTTHVAGSDSHLWGAYSTNASAHSGTRMMQYPDMPEGNRADLVSPAFSIATANLYQVSLWVKRTANYPQMENEGVKVWANHTPDTVGGTPLFHARRSIAQEPAVSSEGWYEYTATIPLTGTVYIVMQGISEYGAATFIDDFSILRLPACSHPDGFVLDADSVRWNPGTATQWQVQEGDLLTVVDRPAYSNPAWAPNSDYSLRVRSICGEGDTADWQPLFAFHTPRMVCSDAMPLPYSEGFSGYDYTGAPFQANAPLPDCWTVLSNGTNLPDEGSTSAIYFSGIGQASSTNNYGCITPGDPFFSFVAYGNYDGTYATYLANMQAYGTRKFALLPRFELPLDRLMMSMDYRTSAASGAELRIGYIVADTADFTPLLSIATDYRVLHHLDRLDFGALADDIPAEARLAMLWLTTDTLHTGDAPANHFCGIDNLLVEAAPTCRYPRQLRADSLGFHSVRLAWTEVSPVPASAWQVLYGPEGFDPESEGLLAEATQPMLLIDSLGSDLVYDFRVRALCADGAYSEWSPALTLRLPCPHGGDVLLGQGALNNYSVAFANYGNTAAQSLFSADELSAAGLHEGDTLNNLVFDWQPAAGQRQPKQLLVYATPTTLTEFPDNASVSDWIAVADTELVYNGMVALTDSGATPCGFASPVVWDGASSLVFTTLLNQPEGSDHSTTGFSTPSHRTEPLRCLFARRDHSAYTLATLGSEAPTSSHFRANLTIERPCLDSVPVSPEPPAGADTVVLDTSFCQGHSLLFFDTLLSTTGTYLHMGDDTVTVCHLEVYPTYSDTLLVSQPHNYRWRDSLYTMDGTYTDSLLTLHGCDSLLTLVLTLGLDPVGEPAWSLAPNPATRQVTLVGLEAKATLLLFDAHGHCILRQEHLAGGNLDLPLSHLPRGPYFIRIDHPTLPPTTRKLIVQ